MPAVALHFMYYNFVRAHQTPCMEACIGDHVWTVREIVEMAQYMALAKASLN